MVKDIIHMYYCVNVHSTCTYKSYVVKDINHVNVLLINDNSHNTWRLTKITSVNGLTRIY